MPDQVRLEGTSEGHLALPPRDLVKTSVGYLVPNPGTEFYLENTHKDSGRQGDGKFPTFQYVHV